MIPGNKGLTHTPWRPKVIAATLEMTRTASLDAQTKAEPIFLQITIVDLHTFITSSKHD
jgi:hypothetical protein